jgi:hypothetical protein
MSKYIEWRKMDSKTWTREKSTHQKAFINFRDVHALTTRPAIKPIKKDNYVELYI